MKTPIAASAGSSEARREWYARLELLGVDRVGFELSCNDFTPLFGPSTDAERIPFLDRQFSSLRQSGQL